MEPSLKKRQKSGGVEPTICVMGATGVGKGSTLNSCFRCDKYSTSNLFASDTERPVSHVLPWRGLGPRMRGVDLCGFSDSEGRDTGFIEAMVAYLREQIGSVNVFLLLLNSQEPRIGVHLKDMLIALKSVFGASFMKHVLVGFTRWDYTKKGAILRRGVTEEALASNVNRLLRDLLGHEHDVTCSFIDNTVSMCTEEELAVVYGDEVEDVRKAFEGALEVVRQAAVSTSPFACGGIESTRAERDVGRDMIEREADAVAAGHEAFARLAATFQERGGGVAAAAAAAVAEPRLSCWASEEPERLQARLDEAIRQARKELALSLAAKTRPDLEHVEVAVLSSFDAKVPNFAHRVVVKNRNAAASANRALRMEIAASYRSTIEQHRKEHENLDGGTAVASEDAARRFRCLCGKYTDLLTGFLDTCQGGPLAWGPFMKLQEDMQMDQLGARECFFRGDLYAGKKLPGVAGPIKGPAALVALLVDKKGAQAPPAWLTALARSSET